MKKSIALAVMLLLMAFVVQGAATSVQAQQSRYTVSGQILWKAGKVQLKGDAAQMAGKPVVGAMVRLGPGNYTATTDAQGRFTVTGVPEGSYAMHIKAKEHSSMTKWVVVNANKDMNLQLLWRSLWLGKGKRSVTG